MIRAGAPIFVRGAPLVPTLAIRCVASKPAIEMSIGAVWAGVTPKGLKVTVRFGGEKARDDWGMFKAPRLDVMEFMYPRDTLQRMLGADQMTLRMPRAGGADDTTFALAGLSDALEPLRVSCPGIPPAPPRAAASAAPAVATPLPSSSTDHAEPQRIGKWTVNRSRSAMDDTTTVVAGLASDTHIKWTPAPILGQKQKERDEQPRLIVRCKQKKFEIYVVAKLFADRLPNTGRDLPFGFQWDFEDGRKFGTNAFQSGDGEAFFFDKPQDRFKDLLGHRELRASLGRADFVFDLTGIGQLTAPVREAACKLPKEVP